MQTFQRILAQAAAVLHHICERLIKLAFRYIEINGNFYFPKHWDGEISQNFTLF